MQRYKKLVQELIQVIENSPNEKIYILANWIENQENITLFQLQELIRLINDYLKDFIKNYY